MSTSIQYNFDCVGVSVESMQNTNILILIIIIKCHQTAKHDQQYSRELSNAIRTVETCTAAAQTSTWIRNPI